jgi:hypothetical protein
MTSKLWMLKTVIKKSFTDWARWFMPVILVTWKVEPRGIPPQGHLGKKFTKTPIPANGWVWDTCLSRPTTRGSTNKRLAVQASPGIK